MSTSVKHQQVEDVMSRNPVSVAMSASARELAEVLEGNNISGVPVIDALGRMVGVVSKTDLLHRCLEGPLGSRPGSFFSALAEGLASGTELDSETLGNVDEFMSVDPVIAAAEESIGAVARRMANERVHRVIVVDEEKRPIGVVTTLDVLKFFPE